MRVVVAEAARPGGEVFAVLFDNCIDEKKERRGRRLASYGSSWATSLVVLGYSGENICPFGHVSVLRVYGLFEL